MKRKLIKYVQIMFKKYSLLPFKKNDIFASFHDAYDKYNFQVFPHLHRQIK